MVYYIIFPVKFTFTLIYTESCFNLLVLLLRFNYFIKFISTIGIAFITFIQLLQYCTLLA